MALELWTPGPPAKTFGKRIRQLRLGRLWQRDLAEQVGARLKKRGKRGFDVTYLSKIESEKFRPPSDAAIIELAAVLEADPDELFALAGKVHPGMIDKLAKNRGAREFLKSAIDRLTQEEWEELLNKLKRRKS
jgi:transcriptional regulator with XRE-family HTH domain